MISVNFDFSSVLRDMVSLRNACSDCSPAMEQIGTLLLSINSQVFAVSGPGWPRSKRRGSPLVRTGDLRRSFTVKGAPGNVWVVGPDHGEFGSDLDYAKPVTEGGPRVMPDGREVNLPQRLVMHQPNKTLSDAMSQLVEDHVLRAIQ